MNSDASEINNNPGAPLLGLAKVIPVLSGQFLKSRRWPEYAGSTVSKPMRMMITMMMMMMTTMTMPTIMMMTTIRFSSSHDDREENDGK